MRENNQSALLKQSINREFLLSVGYLLQPFDWETITRNAKWFNP